MKMTIRKILQSHLMKITDIESTWEGVESEPNLPYQSVFLNISSSLTSAISDKPKSKETGFLQVTLYYQSGKGTLEIEEKANQIRQHFYGRSFTKKGIQVVIHNPPQIGGTYLQDNILALPITINFTAYEL
ncbi:phage tail terminator-like protein [Bisgaard Taxon 45]